MIHSTTENNDDDAGDDPDDSDHYNDDACNEACQEAYIFGYNAGMDSGQADATRYHDGLADANGAPLVSEDDYDFTDDDDLDDNSQW